MQPNDDDKPLELQVLLDKKDWDGAFAWLLKRHAEDVRAWIRMGINDAKAAEDLDQQVWSGVRVGLPKYKLDDNPRAWLYVITRNRLRTHYRDQKKTPIPVDLDADSVKRILVSLPAGMGPKKAVSPFDEVLRRERVAVIIAAMAKWSEEDREIFLLRFAFDFKPQEIAEILTDDTPNNVAQRLFRLLKRIREALAENEAFSSLKGQR